eukprot:TRINITY_DN5984_c0_g1_i1.p1 TRINITY_DN5984_c0_g1~~TRINITY_DN5984_c0_g1_i1.p1  ORF type:complete len:406 (+),score=70.06 TRINITY_DN5984_c0_g1_i1:212-1429(+)
MAAQQLPMPSNQPHSCDEDNSLSHSTYSGGRFDNPKSFTGWHKASMWNAFKWSLSRKEPKPPADVDTALPVLKPDWEKINNPPKDAIQAMWIGHASFLVQMQGLNFLTDPVWSERCSPSQLVGPKRYRPPPCGIDELPPIHFVIISHNHYDHLDALAVQKLGNGPLWIVPKGHMKWFQGMGVNRVVEFDWWDELEIAPELRVVCLPAQHWSKRTLTDDNCALWSGWGVFGSKQRVFFAGDTGYCTGFQEIGKKFGPFDLGLIPIGAYDPRWFMCPQHVDPEEAVQIHVDIQSKKSIGMHWGTFILTDEPVLEPPVRVAADMKKRGLPEDEFIAIKHGEIVAIPVESSSSASSSSTSTKKSKKSKKAVKEVEDTESSRSAATESDPAPKKKTHKEAATPSSSGDDN